MIISEKLGKAEDMGTYDIRPEEVRGGMYVNQSKTLSTVVVPLRTETKKDFN